ncbi:MAG: hypothetical protein A4C66_10765 [Nitrospira sp. HN-bin3]|uniref:hypothetical protein n=1 Tax=Nitrospira cf. moscoviensis SBR1015 TaxID=96242 RepID=UPI000A0C2CC3|nr:hypothetical protein [Nitrospira cf. moscoviensis SBR1015]OQW40308.1 MAG: hypothetical protein A4C66_10765 [Nitrospira sp. HN-bin3]
MAARRPFVTLGQEFASPVRDRLSPLSNLLVFPPDENKRVSVPADSSGEIIRLAQTGMYRVVVKNAGGVVFFLAFGPSSTVNDFPMAPGEILDIAVDARANPLRLSGWGQGGACAVHVLAFRFAEERQ